MFVMYINMTGQQTQKCYYIVYDSCQTNHYKYTSQQILLARLQEQHKWRRNTILGQSDTVEE